MIEKWLKLSTSSSWWARTSKKLQASSKTQKIAYSFLLKLGLKARKAFCKWFSAAIKNRLLHKMSKTMSTKSRTSWIKVSCNNHMKIHKCNQILQNSHWACKLQESNKIIYSNLLHLLSSMWTNWSLSLKIELALRWGSQSQTFHRASTHQLQPFIISSPISFFSSRAFTWRSSWLMPTCHMGIMWSKGWCTCRDTMTMMKTKGKLFTDLRKW